MILAALAALAWADPVALRAQPAPAALVVGSQSHALQLPLGPDWRLSAEAEEAAWLAGIGRRFDHLRGARGWGLTSSLAGSVGVAPLNRQPLVGLSPSLAVDRRLDHLEAGFGLALPAAFSLREARLPLLLESSLSWRAGPVWLGGRLAAGGHLLPGQGVWADASLHLGVAPQAAR